MDREEIIKLAREAWLSDKEAEFITDFDEAFISCTYLQDLTKFTELVLKQDREKLAKKIEKLPFGDTAQSFAVWVREQDV